MLSGTVNGERRAMVYPGLDFAGSGGDAFIARLWAQRKIGALLTQIRLHGADRELVDEVVALSTRFGIVTPYTSFLVEEPALAIGQEGRQLLADRMAAPAGGPQAAPRAGEAAVMKSVTERSLMDSARAWAAAPEAAARLIHVAEKAFLLQDGVWVDTAFEPTGGIPIEVQFGDSAYFDLLARVPEIGRYLALGQRLVVVFDGVAYRVIANASEAKPVSGQASAATAEVPTAPATGSPDATPSSVLRSGDAGQPAPSPSDALPSCSGTLILLGALALLGTGSTVARRRELD
jgi:Ca-activated chloride channel family protein